MDLEIIKLKELSWERERQIYDIVYMWNLKKKKKTNEPQNTNRATDIQTYGYHRGDGGGGIN